MPLDNFSVVKRFNEIRLCRSEQPNGEAYQSLRDIGIESIFKLDYDDEYKDQEEELKSVPMTVYIYHLPKLYRYDHINDVIAISKAIQGELIKGKSCLVHCSHGRDRTGLVIGAWQLMYDNKTLNEVNDYRHEFGMSLIINVVDYPDKLILEEIDRQHRSGMI